MATKVTTEQTIKLINIVVKKYHLKFIEISPDLPFFNKLPDLPFSKWLLSSDYIKTSLPPKIILIFNDSPKELFLNISHFNEIMYQDTNHYNDNVRYIWQAINVGFTVLDCQKIVNTLITTLAMEYLRTHDSPTV